MTDKKDDNKVTDASVKKAAEGPNVSAGTKSGGEEPRPTTVPATVKTEAERVQIEESPIADAVNKEITGPARLAEPAVVAQESQKAEATDEQKAEAKLVEKAMNPEALALEKLAAERGINTDPDSAPTGKDIKRAEDNPNVSRTTLIKGAELNTPVDNGPPETISDAEFKALAGENYDDEGDGGEPTAGALERGKAAHAKLRALVKGIPDTTPDSHVFFGYADTKVTAGDLRHLFNPETK